MDRLGASAGGVIKTHTLKRRTCCVTSFAGAENGTGPHTVYVGAFVFMFVYLSCGVRVFVCGGAVFDYPLQPLREQDSFSL